MKSNVVSLVATSVWIIATLVWFALRVFGVTDVSWWWATIGIWVPVFIAFAIINLAASLYFITNIVYVLTGKAPSDLSNPKN